MHFKIDELSHNDIALIAACLVSSYEHDLSKLDISTKDWNNFQVNLKRVLEKSSKALLQQQIDNLIVKLVKNFNKPTLSYSERGVENGKTIFVKDFNSRRK